jgi:carboxymethylenebutenolidase
MSAHSLAEDEILVPTADGNADAVLFRWTDERQRPGVLFLPDGIGLRPSQRQMARRVAGEGTNVLLPNIYYRVTRPPIFPPRPDFGDERIRARFDELKASLPPAAMERDGAAYVDFLAARPEVSAGPMGVVGYCFTGGFAVIVAAVRPGRIAAAASFHGGRLYRDDPSSPHLALPRIQARLYFGHGRDDKSMTAEDIAQLESALAAWGGRYESETYHAKHGWTVPDSAAYDEPEAERAFDKLRTLFAETLT